MSVLIKYIIKNVLSKPLRTLVLTLCIVCCGFVGMLSFDIVNNVEDIFRTMLSQVTGEADIYVADKVGTSKPYEVSFANKQLSIYSRVDGTVRVPEGVYTYFTKENFSVDNMDYKIAEEMRMLPAFPSIGNEEAVVSKLFSDKQGKGVGDVISLTDDYGNKHDYTIKEIFPNAGYSNGKQIVFLSDEGYALLAEEKVSNSSFIQILDDTTPSKAVEELEGIVYNGDVQNILDSEDIKEQVSELAMIFLLIFLVCFFLVIFVAISTSGRIVCERMSVIGTLRSLGISAKYTSGLLIAENATYGLIGGVIGWLLYVLVRPSMYSSIFTIQASAGISLDLSIPPIKVWVVLAVIILSVLVMVACPIKEIVKAEKIAIRDIIFDNKDTAYVLKMPAVVIGIICVVVALICFFIKDSIMAQVLCFAFLIVGLFLLFPLVLKGVTILLSKLFVSANMPIANLAAVECSSKKSTVGGAVLCVTASVLSMIIFMMASNAGNIYDLKTYDCELHAMTLGRDKETAFSYIKDLEGVSEVESIYGKYEKVSVNDEDYEVNLFGLNEGGYKLFTAVKDAPEKLDNNSLALDKALAEKMGIYVGDEVKMTMATDSYTPITRNFKVAGFIDSYNYDTTRNMILISKDLYIDVYHDKPNDILVRTNNPEKTAKEIKKYSSTKLENVETIAEYKEYWKDKQKGMVAMEVLIICVGIGLTIIGMVSNQIIGFEGRKRECAVLAATAMTKGKIKKMFFLEGLIAYGTALILAFPVAMLSIKPFCKALELLNAGMKIETNLPLYMALSVALLVVFMLVTLVPIKALRKMKISEQLKYE